MERPCLHIIQGWSPALDHRRPGMEGSATALDCCARLIAAEPGVEHRVLLLGPASASRQARAVGLPVWRTFSPALGRPRLAWRAIREAHADMIPSPRVICWGSAIARAARLARVRGEPPPPLHELALLASPAPPGPTRAELGIAEDELVFVAATDPPSRIESLVLTRALSLPDVEAIKVCGLFPLGSWGRERARRFHRDVGLHVHLRFVEVPWTRLLGIADYAVLEPRAFPKRDEHTQLDWAGVRLILGAGTRCLAPSGFEPALAMANDSPFPMERLLIPREPGHAAMARTLLADMNWRPPQSELLSVPGGV